MGKTARSVAGQPQDDYDAALTDSIERFEIDIHPFREPIEGQRMDLRQNRYETFASLYDSCCRVAGTVGLMSLAVIGTQPTLFNTPCFFAASHALFPNSPESSPIQSLPLNAPASLSSVPTSPNAVRFCLSRTPVSSVLSSQYPCF
ncbi:squalene/phytoene synthase [Leptolyngbya boryana NIES-2135]|uniref:Squalene/phytoene synthase n=1 Tax=Leptolyngbya boryana NIES-2135 TaxID=1973484 RepID=A0A1Z4JGS0_LEPBY|nr:MULTISPECIES: squalene/phytoene synthase family protein [Leptolyngbya]ULP32798.1 squalene/phytoene synthase family protein [Leptolyngbya boryana IU 594]BAY55921.1 squalene/phytoene synthase [Leptolyngbya boryana NIES-2135]